MFRFTSPKNSGTSFLLGVNLCNKCSTILSQTAIHCQNYFSNCFEYTAIFVHTLGGLIIVVHIHMPTYACNHVMELPESTSTL